VTRAGGAVLLGALLTISATAFDSPSLYVPGVALVLLGAGSWIWVALAAQGAALVRSTGPASIEEEQPYPLLVELRPGLLPPPGGELNEPLLPEPLPLRRRHVRRVRVDVRFARRGRHRLEPARVVIRDPIGLARRERVSGADQVLVLPRVEPVSARGAGVTSGLGRESDRLSTHAAELELDSLRPYRPGTPASRIHWPTVARTGTMVERRLIADVDSRPLVVMDPRRPESEEALDRAVRAAASLCVHLAHPNGCALLLPGDHRAAEIDVDLHSWPALHARLALLEADAGAPASTRIERAGAVFWVSAGAAAAPAGIARAVAAARYIVTPTPLPGRPVEFTVAGCSCQRLGRGHARRAA
jgi:uncharacterized protein (DUF58 family)